MLMALVAGPLCAGEIERIVTPHDDIVGLYGSRGERYCVTWRPNGGLYVIAIDPDYTSSHDGPLLGTLIEDEGGELVWGKRSLRLDRKGDRVVAITVEGDQPPPLKRLDPEPYRQHQIAWFNQGLRLVGTVMIPAGDGPFPAAALIQGAGTSGRNNLWAWTFADALALRGVAVLIPDKRGSGLSEGQWIESDFGDLAGDAAESLSALRSFPEVDSSRSGVVGLSQGGWVAPLAAARAGAFFSASLVSSFTRPLEQIRHEVEQDFEEAGLSRADVARLNDAVRRLGEYIAGTGTWEAYERTADTLRVGATAELASTYLPEEPSTPNLAFLRGIYDFDFPGAIAALEVPRLLVFGSLDERDNTPVGASLRRLGDLVEDDPTEDLEIRVYPGVGHALADMDTRWVSPWVLDDLADWIKRQGTRGIARADGTGDWRVDVPFEFVKNQIVLEVEINGAGPFRMLLDTGADPSAMDLAAATVASLSVDIERSGVAEGVGDDDVPIYPLTIEGLVVDGHEFGDMAGLAFDLSSIGQRLGLRLDGILGISFLADKIVQIDYPARRVRIASSIAALGLHKEEPWLEMPLEFVAGDTIPLLRQLVVNGKPLVVSLDTGSSLALTIFSDGITSLGLEEDAAKGESATVVGARGEARVTKVRLRDVRLGPFELGATDARLAVSRSEEGRSGNVGNRLLAGFVLTLDYREHRIILTRPMSSSD